MSEVGSPWIERRTERFTLRMLVGSDGLDPIDDNVDIEVELVGDPERWGATVYTLANLDSLMRRWEHSGECGGGRYFCADHAVIVRELTPHGVVQVIEALLDADEFVSAMEQLDQEP
ncbi:MAG: hypothetical protein M3450_02455 [Actinomycetota bacterium]|nr:hypothetical protein [Actinomycetota bacterium]